MNKLYNMLGNLNELSAKFTKEFKRELSGRLNDVELENYRTLIYEIKNDMGELLEAISSSEE